VLLEEFPEDPQKAYLKAERYVNGGSPSGLSNLYTTSERTQPRSQYPSFDLSLIRFDQGVVIEDIGEGVGDYIAEDCMYVHPDMLESTYLLNDGAYSIEKTVAVAPTASGRTVMVLGQTYFLKLAYMGYLGRLVRHINREIVLSAREVTRQLVTAVQTNKLNPAFSILQERCGRIAHVPINRLGTNAVATFSGKGKTSYELGVLFRDGRPFPYVDEEELLVPFFSLFSKEYDPRTGLPVISQDKPLLIQLFERQTKQIDIFLVESILYPLFNTYYDALIYGGVELEAHAQNMLLTIDRQGTIKRIVCRDLESAGRDLPVMEYMGIEYVKDGTYKCNAIFPKEPKHKYPKYYITHSFMFDFKLGEYLVTPLIDLANQYYPFDREALGKKIKEFNRQFIDQLPSGYYPPDWCRYESINWEREGREREYIWQNEPKYR
jgi:hypothetical protein